MDGQNKGRKASRKSIGRPLGESGTRVLVYFTSDRIAAAARRFCIQRRVSLSEFITDAVERELAEYGIDLHE